MPDTVTPGSDAPDPARCPLCGGANACGAVRGTAPCWCMSAHIPDDVLARIPGEQRDVACICAHCASGTAPRRIGT